MWNVPRELVANSYAEFRVRLLSDSQEVYLYTLVLELTAVRQNTLQSLNVITE
jgi:hypothetical protein